MLHSFLCFPYFEIFFVNIGLLISEQVKGKRRAGDYGVRGTKNAHIIINKKICGSANISGGFKDPGAS